MNYENLYGWFPQETVPFYTLRDKNETLVVMKVEEITDISFRGKSIYSADPYIPIDSESEGFNISM